MNYNEVKINNQKIKLIPLGECACGCGGKTSLAKETDRSRNRIKNRPMKFIAGHVFRVYKRKYYSKGKDHHRWNGGNIINGQGYRMLLISEHPNSDSYGYVREHVVMVEKVIGKYLPKGSIVHHVNEDKIDNRNNNYVLCEDRNYHELIHQRLRAYQACGHASWRKCWICKQYDDPQNLSFHGHTALHLKCKRAYRKAKHITGQIADRILRREI